MQVIWATLRKELSELLRDKRTLLLTVLVPMVFYPALIMLAGGLSAKQQMKEQVRVVKVGIDVQSGRYEPQLITELNEKDEHMQWQRYESGDIEKMLSSGEVDLFAEVKSVTTEDEPSYMDVTLHYYSTARGESDLRRAERVIAAVKKEAYEGIAGKLYHVSDYKDYATVRESAGSKFGGAAAYFLVFLAFTGCMAVAVDVAAGEKERGTLEAMLVTPAAFWDIAFGKLIFVVLMGLLSVLSTAIGIGSMVLIAGKAIEGMSLGNVGPMSVLGIIFMMIVLVFFFAVLLFSLSILARSSKEAHMRSSLLMLFIAMALVYCTLPGIELTTGLLSIPVLNVALALRGLWEGTLSIGSYALVLTSLLVLSLLILWFVSSRVKGNSEKVLLK